MKALTTEQRDALLPLVQRLELAAWRYGAASYAHGVAITEPEDWARTDREQREAWGNYHRATVALVAALGGAAK